MMRSIIFAVVAAAIITGGIYYSRNSDGTNDKQATAPASSSEPENKTSPENTAMNNDIELNGNTGGLKIEDVMVGSGASARAGDTVTVHYTGTFADGRKFDSSLDRGEPFVFTIGAGGVIEGWDKGVVGMQAGGTRKLVIPSEMGYGPRDYGPIPGGSTLYFTIELLNIASPASE